MKAILFILLSWNVANVFCNERKLALEVLWVSVSSHDRFHIIQDNKKCLKHFKKHPSEVFDYLGDFPINVRDLFYELHPNKNPRKLLEILCSNPTVSANKFLQPYLNDDVQKRVETNTNRAIAWIQKNFPTNLYSNKNKKLFLSRDERNAIKGYIGVGHSQGHGHDSDLNKALLKIPSCRKYTFRGAMYAPDGSDKKNVGSIMMSTGVNSTSQFYAVNGFISQYGNNTYIINGVSAKSVAHLSGFFYFFVEREAIYPAGTSFVIYKSRPKQGRNASGHKIYLKEIPGLHYWRDYLRNVVGSSMSDFAYYFK